MRHLHFRFQRLTFYKSKANVCITILRYINRVFESYQMSQVKDEEDSKACILEKLAGPRSAIGRAPDS